MTFLEAAHKILAESSEPLHFEEITKRAIAQGMISTEGSTPAATMGSRLYTVSKDEDSDFVREGRGRFALKRGVPKGIDVQLNAINQATRVDMRNRLLSMHPKAFESLLRELLIRMGFDEASLHLGAYVRDGGIDVAGVYKGSGLTSVYTIVQAKRWKQNVQRPTVQNVRGTLVAGQQGVIITTSGFSSGAIEDAQAPGKVPIALIDGKRLIELMIVHGVGISTIKKEVILTDDDFWKAIDLAQQENTAAPADEGISSRTDDTTVSKSKSSNNGRKLQAITVLGERHAVRHWKDGLLAAMDILYARDPARFEQLVVGIGGKKRTYVGTTPEHMHTPSRVGRHSIYIETNQSSTSIKALLSNVLRVLGLPQESVEWIESKLP